MDYKNMISEAQSKGLTNESKMLASVNALGAGLEMLKSVNPKMYWRMMRDQHEIIYEGHYSEEMARHDVSQLSWIDNFGTHEGEYWTMAQIKEATASMRFPSKVNDWDKWVAFNSFYSDVAGEADDEIILKMAHAFFFADYDYNDAVDDTTKIWDYMKMVHY